MEASLSGLEFWSNAGKVACDASASADVEYESMIDIGNGILVLPVSSLATPAVTGIVTSHTESIEVSNM